MLFLVSGPSGSGKTSLMRSILDREIVSVTTREPRAGEVEGVDYHYISKDEFNRLKDSGGLAEWSEYGGNCYGITVDEIHSKTRYSSIAFAIVDYKGMRQLRTLVEDSISIFLWCDQGTAMRHMQSRGDTLEVITRRMDTFASELKNRIEYNYVVRNHHGRFEATRHVVQAIISAEASR